MSEKTEDRWTVCCGHCKFFLAMTDQKSVSVQYKYKDLYIYFYGGAMVIICKGCGRLNYLIDDTWEKTNVEQATKIRAMLNSTEAIFRKWIPHPVFEQIKEQNAEKVKGEMQNV